MASTLIKLVLSQLEATYLLFAFFHLATHHTPKLQRCPGILQNRKGQGNKRLSFVLSHAGMHYLDSLGPGTVGFATKRDTEA